MTKETFSLSWSWEVGGWRVGDWSQRRQTNENHVKSTWLKWLSAAVCCTCCLVAVATALLCAVNSVQPGTYMARTAIWYYIYVCVTCDWWYYSMLGHANLIHSLSSRNFKLGTREVGHFSLFISTSVTICLSCSNTQWSNRWQQLTAYL